MEEGELPVVVAASCRFKLFYCLSFVTSVTVTVTVTLLLSRQCPLNLGFASSPIYHAALVERILKGIDVDVVGRF